MKSRVRRWGEVSCTCVDGANSLVRKWGQLSRVPMGPTPTCVDTCVDGANSHMCQWRRLSRVLMLRHSGLASRGINRILHETYRQLHLQYHVLFKLITSLNVCKFVSPDPFENISDSILAWCLSSQSFQVHTSTEVYHGRRQSCLNCSNRCSYENLHQP